MISKELLSEVLDIEIKEIGKLVEGILLSFRYPTHWGYCNIYELAHKCKEWAISKGWVLHEVRNLKEYIIYFSGDFREPSNDFRADTEHEAIFQACEWILKESK